MQNSEDYSEYVMYPGRFQPPHIGHMTIFDESLAQGKNICIAIRNIAPDEKNPLPPTVVKKLWEKVYKGNPAVKVIIIPNISAIKYGRSVGYSVEEIKVGVHIAKISATDIRRSIDADDSDWKKVVPVEIWDDIILNLGKK